MELRYYLVGSRYKDSLCGLRHQTSDMRRSDSWKLSILMLVVISFYFASAAYGHAIVLYTTPGRRETVRGPDVPIKIRFNSRIDSRRSRLTLLAPDGNQTVLGIVEAASGDSLISEAKGLKSGTYVLRWQVLAVDGHITRGEVPFRVQQPLASTCSVRTSRSGAVPCLSCASVWPEGLPGPIRFRRLGRT